MLNVAAARPPSGAERPLPAADIAATHCSPLTRAFPDDSVEPLLAWCAGLPRATSVRDLAAVVGSRR